MVPSSESEEVEDSNNLNNCCKCSCGKIRLVNERCFMAPPFITLGSSLAEIVVVFSITGFVAIDVIAISACCFSVILSIAALLFIRFDRLTLLAFLMLSVSLLSSSTFLVVCFQKQNVHDNTSAQFLQQSVHSTFGHEYVQLNQSRHGSKLIDLMKSGTELRWIHQLQTSKHCCGFWNFTDWIEESSLLEVNRTYKYHSEPVTPPTKWMVSCCNRNLTRDHTSCKAESIYDDWHDVVQFLFQQGCGSLMDEKFDDINFDLFKTSLGLSFWDLAIGVDLIIYTMWKKLRSKAHNACNGRNRTISTEDDDVFT